MLTIILLVVLIIAAVAFVIKKYLPLRRELAEMKGFRDLAVEDLRRLEEEKDRLVEEQRKDRAEVEQAVQAQLDDRYNQRVERLTERLQHLRKQARRLPIPRVDNRIINTPLGVFCIEKPEGYYGRGEVLWAYFPIGFGFSQELADAFCEATDGKYVLERAPHDDQGGNSNADAAISIGINAADRNRRYGRNVSFDDLPYPDLDDMAAVLQRIIIHPSGVTGHHQIPVLSS